MPDMSPVPLTTKVDLGQTVPCLGFEMGAGPEFSFLKEEASLPSGCRPLEIYLLDFLAGLFYHQE